MNVNFNRAALSLFSFSHEILDEEKSFEPDDNRARKFDPINASIQKALERFALQNSRDVYNPIILISEIIRLAQEKNQKALTLFLMPHNPVWIDTTYYDGQTIINAVFILAFFNDKQSVDFLLNNGSSTSQAIQGAAQGGHQEPLEGLLERYPEAEIGWAIQGAAQGGHQELLEELLERHKCQQNRRTKLYQLLEGIPKPNIYWAIQGAAQGGHQELLNRLLDPQNYPEAKPNRAIAYAIEYAAIGGHHKLLDTLINQHANPESQGRDLAVMGAAHGGHTELFHRLFYTPPTGFWHWTYANGRWHRAIEGAAQGGHQALLNSPLEQNVSEKPGYWKFLGLWTNFNIGNVVRGSSLMNIWQGYSDAKLKKRLQNQTEDVIVGAAWGGQQALLNSAMDALDSEKRFSMMVRNVFTYHALKIDKGAGSWPPIMCAALAGHTSIVFQLLQRISQEFGCSPFLRNRLLGTDIFNTPHKITRFLSCITDVPKLWRVLPRSDNHVFEKYASLLRLRESYKKEKAKVCIEDCIIRACLIRPLLNSTCYPYKNDFLKTCILVDVAPFFDWYDSNEKKLLHSRNIQKKPITKFDGDSLLIIATYLLSDVIISTKTIKSIFHEYRKLTNITKRSIVNSLSQSRSMGYPVITQTCHFYLNSFGVMELETLGEMAEKTYNLWNQRYERGY
ncbi:MAG: hypothetical protein WB791_10445 [Waddliaceae bacterium]